MILVYSMMIGVKLTTWSTCILMGKMRKLVEVTFKIKIYITCLEETKVKMSKDQGT